jgi:hypothetical protein
MLTLTERRRLVVAAAITLIAVPALLLSNNNSSSSANTTSTSPSPVSVAPTDSEPAEPAFLPENNGSQAPEIITVNVPAPPSGSIVKGNASYIRWQGDLLGLRPCATPHALIGAIITVTNLNNGRSLECNNVSIQALPGDNIVLVHTEVFLEIADLIDAPIPVQISF